jgi:hypothetical protein
MPKLVCLLLLGFFLFTPTHPALAISNCTKTIPVGPHTLVEASAKVKGVNIIRGSDSWHRFRMVLTMHDAAGTKLRHYDMVSTHGSWDYKEFKGSIITFPGTATVTLSCTLSSVVSGSFNVDANSITMTTYPVPPHHLAGIEKPIIMPQPAQIRLTKQKLALNTVSVQNLGTDSKLKKNLETYFTAAAIPYTYNNVTGTTLYIGNSNYGPVQTKVASLLNGISWSTIGEEGYFLIVENDNGIPKIYLGGNTEAGRFWGFQTLKQLIDATSVYTAEIADWPTLQHRGMPVQVQFFNSTQRNLLISRINEAKFNWGWNQGSLLNYKFWYNWRTPLVSGEINELAAYVNDMKNNFFEVNLGIGPRGQTIDTSFMYSHDADIDVVVDKLSQAYSAGVRNFGITYDDLQNFGQYDLYYDQDKIKFAGSVSNYKEPYKSQHMGKAQTYLSAETYRKLKAKHPDITFTILVMDYGAVGRVGDMHRLFFTELSKLPSEITFYSSPLYPQQALDAITDTGRRQIIWDNYYADYYRGSPYISEVPEYLIPLRRDPGFNSSNLKGYTFLPIIPALEDKALISWRTTFDFAWSPERYEPVSSFQLASAKYRQVADGIDPTKATVATPIIDPASLNFSGTLTVTLTSSTSGSTIRYTLDGSIPNETSPVYSSPIAINRSSRVRAKAFKSGMNQSGLSSNFYSSLDGSLLPPQKMGDANGNGYVDYIDFLILSPHFNTNHAGGFSVGDFNLDQHINVFDFNLWAKHIN